MQDEGQPFRRGQGVQHDQHRQPDGVGHQRLLLGIALVLEQAHQRLVRPALDQVFAPSLARAQHVEADAADDRRQPPAHVLHLRGACAVQAKPGFLNRIVGLCRRSEHPLRDSSQVRPVSLELLCLPLLCVHPSHPLVGVRHLGDELQWPGVTGRRAAATHSNIDRRN